MLAAARGYQVLEARFFERMICYMERLMAFFYVDSDVVPNISHSFFCLSLSYEILGEIYCDWNVQQTYGWLLDICTWAIALAAYYSDLHSSG